MIDTISNFGQKISEYFGAPKIGTDAKFRERKNLRDFAFSYDHLSSLLGYEYVDTCERGGKDYTLFVSRNSAGFVLEIVPVVGGGRDLEKTVSELFEELLEEGVSIQCLLLADQKVNSYLKSHAKARSKNGHLFFENMRQRALYFKDLKRNAIRNFRFIFSLSMEGNPEDVHLKLIEKKKRALKTFSDISTVKSWDEDEFITNLSALINFNPSTISEKRTFNPLQSIASQLPMGGKLTIEEEGVVWNAKNPVTLKTFRAVDFPDYWSIFQMNGLIGDFEEDSFRINVPFYIHYGIHCPKQDGIEKTYGLRSSIVEKQGRSPFLCRMIPELAEEVSDVNHIRGLIRKGGKFIYTQLSTGFWATGLDIERAEQTMKSLWKRHDFKLQENRYIHFPSFLSTLPMSWGEFSDDLKSLAVLRTTLSSEAVNFVPIQGEWCGTSQYGMILTGRRGQLCNFNVFDGETNYNAVVVGQSGSGKSVFMQELLMNNLGTGGKVYVIDVGGSFEKMCEVLRGQKIEFDSRQNLCLNPFSNIPSSSSEEKETYIGGLKSIISTMAHPSEGASDLENALIEKAILHVWEEKKNEASITDVADYLSAQEEQTAKDLATMLTPYTSRGNYASYFNGKANIDFHNRMVLVELEQLKNMPELQSVILQILILEINRKIFLGDRKTPTIICIDEAWDLLRAKQTGPFIETLARRLRKYNGSLVVGTQSVEDFYQSKGAMAAYDNSSWTCLLSQKTESILAYQEKSRCSDAQIEVLKTVRKKSGEFSEVMISSEKGYSVCRLILDPFSKLLYSTSPEDKRLLDPYLSKGMPIDQAINHVLSKGNH